MKEVLHRLVRRGTFAAPARRGERGMLHAVFFRPARGGRVVLEHREPRPEPAPLQATAVEPAADPPVPVP